jgi:hypothetical protein
MLTLAGREIPLRRSPRGAAIRNLPLAPGPLT